MIRTLPSLLLLLLLQLSVLWSADPSRPGKSNAGGVKSLSGCIDETGAGRYILVDESRLKPKAELEAVGFPPEGFAKYLGQKVTVTGTVSESEGRTVVKVRKVERVSETCAPVEPSR